MLNIFNQYKSNIENKEFLIMIQDIEEVRYRLYKEKDFEYYLFNYILSIFYYFDTGYYKFSLDELEKIYNKLTHGIEYIPFKIWEDLLLNRDKFNEIFSFCVSNWDKFKCTKIAILYNILGSNYEFFDRSMEFYTDKLDLCKGIIKYLINQKDDLEEFYSRFFIFENYD